MVNPVLKVIIFHSIFYYLFGTNVALICFLIYLGSPFLMLSHKFRCYALYMNKIQWPPFLDHSNIKDFGIDGGRHFMLKFDSTIAKQELELGVWHILPRSLCDVVHSMSFSSDEEITTFFNDQLRNSGKPIILYCHGISQSRGNDHRTKMYKVMQDLDAHVITFDYRGFADSTNVMPTKIGLVEDTLAVYAWLKGVSGDDSKVFIWGHSMGGGVICKVMSRLEEYSSSLLRLERPLPLPRGAIIESSFNHIKEALIDFTPLDFIVMLPHFKAIVQSTFVSDADVRVNSTKYVQSVKTVPFLMLHSRDDDIVFLNSGKDLYNTVKSSRTVNDAPVSLELFDGRGHMWICDDERLPKVAGDFIYAHMKQA